MRLLAALAAFSLFAFGIAQEPDRALNLLRRALRAQKSLKYSGERQVEMMFNGDRVVLTEYVLRDGPRSRITYPDDSRRKNFVVVETPEGRWEYDPIKNEIRKMRPMRPEANDMLGGMVRGIEERHFQLKPLGEDTIAGQKAVGVGIADRQGNVGRKFWIDPDTGLVLKAEQFGRVGTKLASFSFKRVNFDPVIRPGDFGPLRREGAKVVDDPRDFDVPWKIQLPTWLPPGFKEVDRGVRHFDGRPVLQLHYSNGQQRFSIFQAMGPNAPEVGRPGPPREGHKPPPPGGRGGMNIRKSRVGDLWSVVVGPLDGETLQRIVESIGRK